CLFCPGSSSPARSAGGLSGAGREGENGRTSFGLGVRRGEQRVDYTLGEPAARAFDITYEPSHAAAPIEAACGSSLCRNEINLRAFEQNGARLCAGSPSVLQ